MLNLKRKQSFDSNLSSFSSKSSSKSAISEAPAFRRYQGTFDHSKYVCEIDDVYDFQKSFDKLNKLIVCFKFDLAL